MLNHLSVLIKPTLRARRLKISAFYSHNIFCFVRLFPKQHLPADICNAEAVKLR
jgi:hypothetical protein